ncbi:MAG: hypothetical protein ACK5O1_04580 [Holosporales bacterium]|jgi:hypothetical protein
MNIQTHRVEDATLRTLAGLPEIQETLRAAALVVNRQSLEAAISRETIEGIGNAVLQSGQWSIPSPLHPAVFTAHDNSSLPPKDRGLILWLAAAGAWLGCSDNTEEMAHQVDYRQHRRVRGLHVDSDASFIGRIPFLPRQRTSAPMETVLATDQEVIAALKEVLAIVHTPDRQQKLLATLAAMEDWAVSADPLDFPESLPLAASLYKPESPIETTDKATTIKALVKADMDFLEQSGLLERRGTTLTLAPHAAHEAAGYTDHWQANALCVLLSNHPLDVAVVKQAFDGKHPFAGVELQQGEVLFVPRRTEDGHDLYHGARLVQKDNTTPWAIPDGATLGLVQGEECSLPT